MLSPAHRITSAADYRRTVRSGERIRGRHCLGHVQATPAGTSARFGFIVSKAVGMAHTRNLVRRRLKAITAEFLAEGLTGVDVVYRAHPSSANASYADLREDLRRGYSRIQQLSEADLEAAGQ